MRILRVNRHRINIDGHGVTTLVGLPSCPLECKYCINSKYIRRAGTEVSYEELYNALNYDLLYFKATNGGVVYGGGEPLLHTNDIVEMSKLINGQYRTIVETSLNVSHDIFKCGLQSIDEYIVDIKSMNSDIYKRYTGKSNECVLNNLKLLAQYVNSKIITIRVPLITGYNDVNDIINSDVILRNLGFNNIFKFKYTT